MGKSHTRTVVIHSMFRAGSTAIFQLFRGMEDVTAFQEPIHELTLANLEEITEFDDERSHRVSKLLRHPELGPEGYFAEYRRIHDRVSGILSEHDIYENFFSNARNKSVEKFFRELRRATPQNMMVQECRTFGRIPSVRRALPGTHVFLLRSPRTQYWSQRTSSYFFAANILIANSKRAPRALQKAVPHRFLASINGETLNNKITFLQNNKLTFDESYTLFYTLWCFSLLAAIEQCDLIVEMERLILDEAHRKQASIALFGEWEGKEHLLEAISIPCSQFSADEIELFEGIESRVHELLQFFGTSQNQVEVLKTANQRLEKLNCTISKKSSQHELSRRLQELRIAVLSDS